MKPPRYPLQAVRDQREALKEGAKRALAAAVQAAAREAEILIEKERARDALLRERAERALHLYDPDAAGLLPISLIEKRTEGLRFLDGRIDEARQAVEAQKQAKQRAEAEVENRRGALVEADRELKVVEKHHETWLADWKREAGRKEQRQSEEITLARYAAETGGDRGNE